MTGGDRHLRRALIALCITEITSWGTLYYSLPAMLVPLSHSTGWPSPAVMGAFSAGLLVSAVAGIVAGRLLDQIGPRPVVTLGSLAGVAALLSVAAALSPQWFAAAAARGAGALSRGQVPARQRAGQRGHAAGTQDPAVVLPDLARAR